MIMRLPQQPTTFSTSFRFPLRERKILDSIVMHLQVYYLDWSRLAYKICENKMKLSTKITLINIKYILQSFLGRTIFITSCPSLWQIYAFLYNLFACVWLTSQKFFYHDTTFFHTKIAWRRGGESGKQSGFENCLCKFLGNINMPDVLWHDTRY